MCCFTLATAIWDPGNFVSSDYNTVSDTSVDGKDEVPASIPLAQLVQGSLLTPINYFNKAATIQQDPQALQLFCTFTGSCTAFHLSWDPSLKQMSINEVAEKFGLLDLHAVLVDFIHCYLPSNPAPYLIGSWLSAAAHSNIGSVKIQVWSSICLQLKLFHNMDEVIPLKLINACPPCEDWPLGLYDNVIVNTNRSKTWPWSGLAGEWNFPGFDKQYIA